MVLLPKDLTAERQDGSSASKELQISVRNVFNYFIAQKATFQGAYSVVEEGFKVVDKPLAAASKDVLQWCKNSLFSNFCLPAQSCVQHCHSLDLALPAYQLYLQAVERLSKSVPGCRR